jgi:hypothetical protein
MNPHTLLVGMKISTVQWENIMEAPQKIKNRTTSDPAILLLGMYPKEYKSGYNKDTYTLMFIAALFTMGKLWNDQDAPSLQTWKTKYLPSSSSQTAHTHTHTHTHKQTHTTLHTHSTHHTPPPTLHTFPHTHTPHTPAGQLASC